jgi:DNA-binding transcriptional MerR regulator
MGAASAGPDVADAPVQIPNRALFKAAEVCEIARVQPYVLRSWELEFPDLGVARTAGGPRVYRRHDLERVLRIKQLVFGEGLTLAGARRRLGEDGASADEAPFDELLGLDARERVAEVRRGLRSLLDLLSSDGQTADATLFEIGTVPAAGTKPPPAVRANRSAPKGSRKKPGTGRSAARR